MALSNSALLRPQTVLQQLLEEINFQRAKEMRQMLKDDGGGFVMLQGTTYWTDLFVRHFLFQAEAEQSIDSDDLLFFVRKNHIKGSSRHMPKFETDVDVYRKDSRKLPIGDPDVDWEETVYLNLIIHQFNYTLTLAICTRTSPKELQVLRRHSQRVYASPSRRKMDTKGFGEEMTYPNICFMVDNFDEVFCDIMVRDGEMVCVELVANDRDGTVQGVIFLGSIRYDALKRVYDARQSSISSKLAQLMTFGLFSGGGPQTRCEFVRMKGPQGKGHAEMAVTKPKGSGVETPTSEPGFCMTDMYDEWEEDPDDYFQRHQRRLSDPSANLNDYSRYGWKTKPPTSNAQTKAMSQNEGLDSLINEVSEIEAGDLRDDGRSASPKLNKVRTSSASTASTKTTATCCNCFGPLKNQNQMDDQMSEVYCRACEDDIYDGEYVQIPKDRLNSPAILTNVTQRRETRIKSNTHRKKSDSILKSQSNFTTAVIHHNKSVDHNQTDQQNSIELGDDIVTNSESLNESSDLHEKFLTNIDTKDVIRVRGKEELPVYSEEQIESVENQCHTNPIDKSLDEASLSDTECDTIQSQNSSKCALNDVRRKVTTKYLSEKVNCTNDHPLVSKSDDKTNTVVETNLCDNRNSAMSSSMNSPKNASTPNFSTLPKMKKNIAQSTNRQPLSMPTRVTSDGTTIYYLCDLSKGARYFSSIDLFTMKSQLDFAVVASNLKNVSMILTSLKSSRLFILNDSVDVIPFPLACFYDFSEEKHQFQCNIIDDKIVQFQNWMMVPVIHCGQVKDSPKRSIFERSIDDSNRYL